MDPKQFTSQAAGKVVRSRTGIWVFIPNPLPPEINWSTALVAHLAEAERALSKLAARIGSFPFPRLLTHPLIRMEAVLSSRIEGTRASLADVLTYEVSQLPLFERTGDVREVHNYVRAIDYGLDRLQTLPVSLRLLRELHARLMEGVRGGMLTPGAFRRSQNWIGPAASTPDNAPFVPPPLEEMHKALDEMERFIHTETQLSPLIRIGLLHYQFEAIHPFLDGNGRIGRLLIVLLMCAWGLLPQPLLNLSAYFERYRQAYYDYLLAVSREGDWEAWLQFFLRGVHEQASADLLRMQSLNDLRMRYQPIAEGERNSARMSAVIDFLFTRPIFSIRQAADGLDIPYVAAQRYVDRLVGKGLLREVTGYARNRIFRADEILNALQNPGSTR